MAMNKAEKARLEEALTQAALRWTSPIDPDVFPPRPDSVSFGRLSKGFAFNSYAMRVEPACSSSVGHAIGRDDRTTSQGARDLYSSRLLALRAMRAVLERECAKMLRAADLLIEAELSAEKEKN